jgi:hypothetical protein
MKIDHEASHEAALHAMNARAIRGVRATQQAAAGVAKAAALASVPEEAVPSAQAAAEGRAARRSEPCDFVLLEAGRVACDSQADTSLAV